MFKKICDNIYRYFLEKYTAEVIGIILWFILVIIDIFTDINNANFSHSNISFIFATTTLAVLITHKSIIFSTSYNEHSGFKKLINRKDKYDEFFYYLNCPLYISTIIILYNIVCSLLVQLYCNSISTLFSIILIMQITRFLVIFSIVFEKSIINKPHS